MTVFRWLREICFGQARSRGRTSISPKPIRHGRSPLRAMLIVFLLRMSTCISPPEAPSLLPLSIWTNVPNNFDIRLSRLKSTTSDNNGYETQLRVGQQSTLLKQAQTKTLAHVTISTHLIYLSDNAMLIAFKLENPSDSDITADVGVQSDVSFDGSDSAPIGLLPDDRGFFMYSATNAFTIIVNSYPLVENVTNFWFGLHGSESFWTKKKPTGTYETSDSALAFSWQDITVPSKGSATVSAIVRSGLFDSEAPVLVLNETRVPANVTPMDVLKIDGSVTDSHDDVEIDLILVINDDYSQLDVIYFGLMPGEGFDFDLSLTSYALGLGSYELSFYAVDTRGCVSNGQTFRTEVIFSSIFFSYAPTDENANFEIFLINGNEVIPTSKGAGYYTRMRIEGQVSAEARKGEAVKLLGLTLSTHLTSINDKAVLIVFELKNANGETRNVDVEVDAVLAENEVNGWSGDLGFSVGGSPGFLFIGRSYPLVNNVTSLWYGPSDDLSAHYWDDWPPGTDNESDASIAFSWQNITVPGNGATTVSAIMRYGPPSEGSVDLDLNGTEIPSHVGISRLLTIVGSLDDSNDSAVIDVLLVVNDDHTRLYRIASKLHVNAMLEFQLSLPAYSISIGEHKLSFYAVDNFGYISSGHDFTVTVGPDPTLSDSPKSSVSETPTPSLSDSPTPTDSISQSPAESPSKSLEQSPPESPPESPSKSLDQSPSNSPESSLSESLQPTITISLSPEPTQSLTEAQSPNASPPMSAIPSPSVSASEEATRPMTSPLQTRSVSESYSGSQSPIQSPSLSPTISPISTPVPPKIDFSYGGSEYFDISAIVGGVTISTASWRTQVSIDDHSLVHGFQGQPISDLGVTMTPHLTVIGDQTVLIVFKVTNENLAAHQIDIAVDADVDIDGRTDMIIEPIVGGQGFAMTTDTYTFAFIGRSYPLVWDVSSYWYGPYRGRGDALWGNGSGGRFSGDGGLAFSWQGISVPQESSVTVSAILRYGYFDSTGPFWTFSQLGDPSTLSDSQSVTISGTVSDTHPSAWIDVLLVINNDMSQIVKIAEGLSPGVQFNISFELDLSWVSLGPCTFDYYAANSVGCISPGPSFTSTKIGSPRTPRPSNSRSHSPSRTSTPTPSRTLTPSRSRSRSPSRTSTPTPSRTLTPSRSRSRSPSRTSTPALSRTPTPSYSRSHSPSRTSTPTPSRTVSRSPSPTPSPVPPRMAFSYGDSKYFNAFAYVNEVQIRTTYNNYGYDTRMHVDGNPLPASGTGGWPVSQSGVTMTLHLAVLGRQSLLIVFKFTNADLFDHTVDVEVDADAMIGGADAPYIATLPNDIGFSMTDTSGYSSATITFIGRSYPLVEDVSSYWFGPYNDRSSHYWNSFSITSPYQGDGGITYSWQQVYVPAEGFAVVSAIMRVGQYDSTGPTLEIIDADIPSWLHGLDSVAISGYVYDSHQSVWIDLILVVNNDYSNIRTIRTSLVTGDYYNFGLSLDTSDIALGPCVLSFYAVDSVGCISSDVSYQTTRLATSRTPRPSSTRSHTPVPTDSPRETPSPTRSRSRSRTPSRTRTPTPSPSRSQSPSPTASRTRSKSPSVTRSPSRSRSPSHTPSPTASASRSHTPTVTRTPPPTPTASKTPSPTASATRSKTPSRTRSPSPTASRSRTPTATASPPATRTRSRSRTPFRTANPVSHFPLAYNYLSGSGVDANFDVYGLVNEYVVSTTGGRGYRTRMRVDTILSSNVVGGYSVSVSDVTLTTHLVSIARDAVLIAFKILNEDTADHSVDLEVDADMKVDENSEGTVADNSGYGFTATAGGWAFTFIGKWYPLASELTTYWFGDSGDRAQNYWNSVLYGSEYTGSIGIAFSWQQLHVAAGSSRTVSVIVKSGRFTWDRPYLSMYASIPSQVLNTQSFTITATASDVTSGVSIDLVLMINGDSSLVYRLSEGWSPGQEYSQSISLEAYGVREGYCSLSFYAVNTYGCVSDAVTFGTDIVVPRIAFTHSVSDQGDTNFDVFARRGSSLIYSTGGRGYRTRIRIEGDLATAHKGRPVTLWDVTLTSHLTVIGDQALLVVFKLTNAALDTRVVDVLVDADVYMSDDGPLIWDLGSERGFVIADESNTFTFITRLHPLVRDVSTYWFGHFGERVGNFWGNISSPYFSGGDSAVAFSWQQVVVPPESSVTVSVIVRYGDVDTASAALDLTATTIGALIGIYQPVPIRGVVYGSRSSASVDVILIVNDDYSNLYYVLSELSSGSTFDAEFAAVEYSIGLGVHKLTFFAVDSFGCISEGRSFETNVIETSRTSAEPVEGGGNAASAGEVAGAAMGAVSIIALLLAGAILLVKFVQSRRLKEYSGSTDSLKGHDLSA